MHSFAKLESDKDIGIDFDPVLKGFSDALALMGQANVQINMARRDFL